MPKHIPHLPPSSAKAQVLAHPGVCAKWLSAAPPADYQPTHACARHRLNKYSERLKLCPDGILTQDDVDDLCHELGEPQLLHPLTELRNR